MRNTAFSISSATVVACLLLTAAVEASGARLWLSDAAGVQQPQAQKQQLKGQQDALLAHGYGFAMVGGYGQVLEAGPGRAAQFGYAGLESGSIANRQVPTLDYALDSTQKVQQVVAAGAAWQPSASSIEILDNQALKVQAASVPDQLGDSIAMQLQPVPM